MEGYSRPFQTSVEEKTNKEGFGKCLISFINNLTMDLHLKINKSKISFFLDPGHTETHPSAAERSSFPLPELQFLNLANNKVCWINCSNIANPTLFKIS